MSWQLVVIKGVGKAAVVPVVQWVWSNVGEPKVKNHINKDTETKLREARDKVASLNGKLRKAEIDSDKERIAKLTRELAKAKVDLDTCEAKAANKIAEGEARPGAQGNGFLLVDELPPRKAG
jgi:hypothetical protein